MEKQLYEQMKSDNEESSTSSYQNILKKSGKKNQGFLKLMIGLLLLFIVLTWLFISKLRKLSNIKALNSELTFNLDKLKAQELDLQKSYEKLNMEKEEMIKKNEALSNDIHEYQSKNEQLLKQNNDTDPEIKELEKELELAEQEGKKLNSENDEAQKRIEELKSQTEKYDKDIEDLKNQIKELDNQFGKDTPKIIKSSIVVSEEEINYINQLFSGKKFEFRQLYRKTDYGLSSEMFHKQCDGAEKTLVLLSLLINGNVLKIGGFATRKWDPIRESDNYKTDNNSILFSITSKKTYPVTNVEKAIYCNYKYLAVFNNDLVINEEGIKSSFPHAYGSKNSNKLELTNGIGSFPSSDVLEMEVFEVIPAN